MPRRAAKKPSDDFPEFPVKREVFCAMFTPPLPKSTFYDRVKDGRIVALKGVPGYFLLNESRRLMGLPPVVSGNSNRPAFMRHPGSSSAAVPRAARGIAPHPHRPYRSPAR